LPKRRDDIKAIEQVGIRMTTDLRERCKAARLEGAFNSIAESQFLSYLIEIGLSKYEKTILPHELEEHEVDNQKTTTHEKTA